VRPDTYRQAGVLLAQLHGQLAVQDPEFEAAPRQKGAQIGTTPGTGSCWTSSRGSAPRSNRGTPRR